MIELSATGVSGTYHRGIAGDSFNTASYLARAGFDVDYLTRLGDDPLSAEILTRIRDEGIGVEHIDLCEGGSPGLYMIDNDEDGERVFTYWRDNSPARGLFDDALVSLDCTHFYFTGITLAVMRSGFGNLLATLRTLKSRGTSIIFDPNFRPALWESVEEARQYYGETLPLCDLVLPTLEDETALWGIGTIGECEAMYRRLEVGECVIKGPALKSVAYANEECFERQARAVPAVDTTGAGDAFNAGYLAVRFAGGSLGEAVKSAQHLSAQVVQHAGAICPNRT